MTDLLSSLNEPQREAVLTTDGPVLMLAGAGSGKTKALTHRIAYLVAEKKVRPSNILAVTFTNKAAGEMRARVLRLLGRGSDERQYFPYVGTFHAISCRMLRRDYKEAGLTSSFTIFDMADSLSAIKQAMRQIGIDEKRFTPSLIANLISSAKNQLIGPDRYAGYAKGDAQEAAAKVYPGYQRILTEANAVDFDDIIMKTVLLLRNPEVLARWQEQFHYILIDEYQDTNYAQYQLAKLLAAKHRNLCVVGDDWQAIYSWRGANFQNILDFEKDYPQAKVVKLEQNYRSSKNILDAAHSVISKNQVRSSKKLWTDAAEGAGIKVVTAYDQQQEGDIIAMAIERLMRESHALQRAASSIIPNLQLSDFAVLYRMTAQSRALEEAFLRHNVPYKIVGGTRFYERKEIKDVLAYMRFISNPDDIISFGRIINVPARGLGDRSLERLLDYGRQNGLSLMDTLQSAGLIEVLTPRARTAILNFHTLISGFQEKVDVLPVPELLQQLVTRSGYLTALDDGSVLAGDRIENVKELLSVAADYEGMNLGEFLEEIALVSDLDNYSTESNAVTLMTLHAAKGLEFPVVFMPGMEEGIFPHNRSLAQASEMEEERRLCYVGMTRAKQELYLLHAQSRLLHGQIQRNVPSRFLGDLPPEVQDEANSLIAAPSTVIPSSWGQVEAVPELAPEKIDLHPGDKIRHAKFGDGIVTHVHGDDLTAAFEGVGTKHLSLSFAPVEKL
ncbi:MAG TPA: UvrD-helicase domain-containing protein [Candidatus Saccharimonadia bacterium]